MPKESVKLSKFLSFILRHKPGAAGLTLARNGWVDIDRLIQGIRNTGRQISRQVIQDLVETNDKKRFTISEDGRRIKANQGHSILVDLGLEQVKPPDLLYHGTVGKFMDRIRSIGLVRGRRHHVHLSGDRETAVAVGKRRGSPVVLTIQAGRMRGDGYVFYLSENGVWLTEKVPAEYIGECHYPVSDSSTAGLDCQ